MKQLETSFTLDNNQFTQVKRNDKAALYKRETLEGAFVSYEVFAIMTKNGAEVYPNKTAMSRWAYCPVSEDRANTWFDRITNGDVVIPNVDPETGDPLEAADERTIDELPEVNVDQPVTTVTAEDPTAPTVEVPVNETPVSVDVPTVEVEIPTVDITPDGGAVVTVAKVRQAKVYPTMKLPVGEFLRDDFAELNGFDFKPAHSDSYGPLMREIKAGRVVELRKETRGPGKPRSIYAAVTVAAPAVTAPADATPATV